MATVEEISSKNTINLVNSSLRIVTLFWASLFEFQNKKAEQTINKEWFCFTTGKDGKPNGLVVVPNKEIPKNELFSALKKHGITHMPFASGGEVISKTDYPKFLQIQRRLLLSKSNFYVEVEMDEYENACAQFNPDGNTIKLNGLNDFQYEMIKNKCSDLGFGFTLGSAHTDQGFDLKFSEENVLNLNDDSNNDFCSALLRAYFSLYSSNYEIKKQQILADKENDKLILNMENGIIYDGKAYDNNRMGPQLKIDEEKFVFSNYGKEIASCNKYLDDDSKVKNPDYILQLARYIEHIDSRVIVSDGITPAKRVAYTKEQKQVSTNMKYCADKLDLAINECLRESGFKITNGENCIKTYISLAQEYLKSYATNQPCSWLSAEKQKILDDELRAYNRLPIETSQVICASLSDIYTTREPNRQYIKRIAKEQHIKNIDLIEEKHVKGE